MKVELKDEAVQPLVVGGKRHNKKCKREEGGEGSNEYAQKKVIP